MATGVPVRSARALGKELAQLRFERGLTQGELADRLGLTRRYVYELETGKPNLLTTRLFELLRELGAHVEVVDDRSGEATSSAAENAGSSAGATSSDVNLSGGKG